MSFGQKSSGRMTFGWKSRAPIPTPNLAPKPSTDSIITGSAYCGLYYKHMTIVNYTSSVIYKLEALLTDDARVVTYDCHVFIVTATCVLTNWHYHYVSAKWCSTNWRSTKWYSVLYKWFLWPYRGQHWRGTKKKILWTQIIITVWLFSVLSFQEF